MTFKEIFLMTEQKNDFPIFKVNGKEVKFVRYGGLSPVPQKGFSKKFPTLHSPPERSGFYAFVWPYIEMFLLSGLSKTQKNFKNEPIKKHMHPRTFYYYGFIWHHLGVYVKNEQILDERGGWYKTDFKTYIEALRKGLHDERSSSFGPSFEIKKDNDEINYLQSYMRGKNNFMKDHFEVFIPAHQGRIR